MLRLRTLNPPPAGTARAEPLAAGVAPASAARADVIIPEFDDPYLELLRLLREATEIEHALMVQYLYAAFSVRPRYAGLVGLGFSSARDLMGVAVQEMQHLDVANRFLVRIGGAPNLVRQDFPYEPQIYPFELSLAPLTTATLAKYVYTEAPAEALDPDNPANAAERPFLERLFAALGPGVRPNRLGSLYATVIAVARRVMQDPPPGLADLGPMIAAVERVQGQGEVDHFLFFRSVFLGTHPGFEGRAGVWDLNPSDADYPSFPLPTNPSAFEGHPNQVRDSRLRRIAYLGNLQYWIVQTLLTIAYRFDRPRFSGRAVRHMTEPLLEIGRHLAAQGTGLPFDTLSMGYLPGVDERSTVRIALRMVRESQQLAAGIRDDLPADFPLATDQDTIDALSGDAG